MKINILAQKCIYLVQHSLGVTNIQQGSEGQMGCWDTSQEGKGVD